MPKEGIVAFIALCISIVIVATIHAPLTNWLNKMDAKIVERCEGQEQ